MTCKFWGMQGCVVWARGGWNFALKLIKANQALKGAWILLEGPRWPSVPLAVPLFPLQAPLFQRFRKGVGRRGLATDRAPNVNCSPRGGTGGAKPGSGVQRFWGHLRASEFDPSFQRFGVSETPSQRPLRAPERLSGPRGRLFRGLGEGCPFSTERENKVGHSEASKRPRFPGCPLRGSNPRVPTLGPQIKMQQKLVPRIVSTFS